MYWHGYGGTFEDFLGMTWTDRWFARRSLDELIDISNESGAEHPDDARR